MKILWLTWKDRKHPLAGGAEVVNEALAERLVADGHHVKLIVSGFAGGQAREAINGYEVIRVGGRYSVYWKTYRYYKKHLQGWANLVIDEVNTVPFFAKFYVKEPNLLFVHMLCRQIWFYESPFPVSLIGYLIEPIYLRLLSDRRVITVSESTKKDLMRHGFSSGNTEIISEGIEIEPLESLNKARKYPQPTLLSLGAIRPMKRTDHQIKAFELAKAQIPNLQLKIAGYPVGRYGRKIINLIERSPYRADIEYVGRANPDQKLELLRRCHLLLMTSVKEGWGLTVTEAASQGTPSIVYDVDGLRDSVRTEETGWIVEKNTPQAIANFVDKAFADRSLYQSLRKSGWEWSKQINFDESYRGFTKVLGQ